MADRPLIFETYRLNIVDTDNLAFDFMGKAIRSDGDILRVLQHSTDNRFDIENVSGRSTFRWSIREFITYESTDGQDVNAYGITLGRSVLTQSGQTVTEDKIENALTLMSPPAAEVIHLFFQMSRHLVAVEYNSTIMHSQLWRTSLHEIVDEAAKSLELLSSIRLEPIPREEEIIQAFKSFERITRLRVRLRIPNPELDRRTERLRRDLVAGAIREYMQDMKNPSGLSTEESNLPFATAAMAQAGYKEGDVLLVGVRQGKRVTVRSGHRAARGRIEGLKDFMRGIASTAKTLEARTAVKKILEEVDRIVESPIPPSAED
jgi:hypothetical protein